MKKRRVVLVLLAISNTILVLVNIITTLNKVEKNKILFVLVVFVMAIPVLFMINLMHYNNQAYNTHIKETEEKMLQK